MPTQPEAMPDRTEPEEEALPLIVPHVIDATGQDIQTLGQSILNALSLRPDAVVVINWSMADMSQMLLWLRPSDAKSLMQGHLFEALEQAGLLLAYDSTVSFDDSDGTFAVLAGEGYAVETGSMVMAGKLEQNEFEQGMVRSLEPQFADLRQASQRIEGQLQDMRTQMIHDSTDISLMRQQLDQYYQLSIQHSSNMESQISSLRAEMKEQGETTNRILERIAGLLG